MDGPLIAFASFAFVASVTPGPNNVLLTATGSSVGFGRGLSTLFGITSGFSLMIFVLTMGLGSLVLDHPAVLSVLKILGILMLIWLSYQIAFAPVRQADNGADNHAPKAVGFFAAALFQWVNPKAWLVVGSAISAYMISDQPALMQAITFAAVFFVAGFVGCIPWLAFGSLLQRLLKTERTARAFNYCMGLLLLATIIMIV
jgi:threonine/homoserine/homoserine lactone efflux protein